MPDPVGLLAVSFAVGIVVGMTGMGGGALLTPALIAVGVPPTSAVANDLVAAAANKSIGAAVHWRRGTPDPRLARWLILGSVPTAFLGAFLVDAIGRTGDREEFMRAAIGIALLVAALTYGLRRPASHGSAVTKTVAPRPRATLALGAVGGLMVGVTSVGSGSVIMVVLVLLYPALSPRTLVGTDLVQAVPLVLAAAVGHVLVTGVDWEIFVPLIAGGSPGTFVGARWGARIPQAAVRGGVVLMLLVTGLVMLDVAWFS